MGGEKKVKIRADGGPTIGNGHWSRILTITSFIDTDIKPVLYTKYPQEFFKSFPFSSLEVIAVEQEMDFIQVLQPNDVILLDIYSVDSSYFKILQKKKVIVVYIDDLLIKNAEVDVIINHTPGINFQAYHNPAPYCSFYTGEAFSLISSDFKKITDNDTNRINKLLICMGGADPGLITKKILTEQYEVLKEYSDVHVVLGPHYNKNELAPVLSQGKISNIKFHLALSKTEICNLMILCGTAILPASTMAIEYAHVGGLLTVIQTADNQTQLYDGLLSNQSAIPFEVFISATTDKKISLYKTLKDNQHKRFDGESHLRIQKLFKELFFQNQIQFRKVVANDAKETFTWATNKAIRAFSFSQHEITWEEHHAWFTKKLMDANCVYYIAEKNGENLGSIRFDIHNNEALISFLVAPNHQGKGLGRILLSNGIKYLIEEKKVKKIIGYVMQSNLPSIHAFKRLGFSSKVESDRILFYKSLD